MKDYSIAVISYNTCELTLACLCSIVESGGDSFAELIVVDNASSDGSQDAIRRVFPQVRLVENKDNHGYARAVNQAVKASVGQFVLIANADIVFDSSILTGFDYLEKHPQTAVMGCAQFYPDGRYQRSYGEVPNCRLAISEFLYIEKVIEQFRRSESSCRVREVGYADGAALWLRREIFMQLGGFDEDFFFYTEEADYCYRARTNGFSVVSNPNVSVIHYRGAASGGQEFSSSTVDALVRSKILFLDKHSSSVSRWTIVTLYAIHHLINSLLFICPGILLGKKSISKARVQLRFACAWLRLGNCRG